MSPDAQSGPAQDCAASPTEHLFTGKERDAETGNDYFGARYYASSMGRFLTPDWSAKVEPVPYSKLDDPQTLNLYAYVGNNPFVRVDADGHQTGSGGATFADNAEANAEAAKKNQLVPRDFAPPPPRWHYQQTTGNVTLSIDMKSGTGRSGRMVLSSPKGGYAGHGKGVNNPDNQFVHGANAGPPPRGTYTIGAMGNYTIKTGPHRGEVLRDAMTLTPEPGTNMGQPPRAGLLIHGAQEYSTQTHSQGCEVLPPSTRHEIGGSGVTQEVVDR